MKISFYIYVLSIVSIIFTNLHAEHLISLFLKPYPNISSHDVSKKVAQKIHRPGKIASQATKHTLSAPVGGIFATYGGYLVISDSDGEITFPRKTTRPFLYLIITERLTPIVMSGNTLAYWERNEDAPAAVYAMEQKFDTESRAYYWEVTQEPIPATTKVPLESIIIFADPKYVYVPLGITLTQQSPHLLLPDIYIKNGNNLTANALYVTNLAHYFGGVLPLFKREKHRFQMQLTY